MKKIIGILSFFFVFGLIVCACLGFFIPVGPEVPKNGAGLYKTLNAVTYFFQYLPVIFFTGFIVALAVHFGRNAEGSIKRFSEAMFSRYKLILITSLIFILILSLTSEVFNPLINRKKARIINQPKLINEYVKVGNNLLENEYYERALRYAEAALSLDSNSKEANTLRDKAEEAINRISTTNIRFKLFEENLRAEKTEKTDINAENLSTVYKYYQMAQKAYDNQEWFNAHYYAQIALSFATPKDPNLDSIKHLQTDAWNKLTEYHVLKKSEVQILFDKKYEGYLALLEKNDLKAYYIFNELSNSSRELASDPDVLFFLDIAENRVKEKYFFIDETFELESFESANDIYFSNKYADGSQDIVYFKGMTSVKQTGNSMQYLRDLTITSIDNQGKLIRSMTVPYAKVLPVSTKELTPASKELMGIKDSVDFVPYIMLNSVGRDKPNTEVKPLYKDSFGNISNTPGYTILPVSYSDFVMLENSPANPADLSINSLFTMFTKADDYGYSKEVYGHILLNRLFYPFWLLLIFIFLAIFAWNTRVGVNDYFKMTWAFSFPLLILLMLFFYDFSMYIFKLLNYAIIAIAGVGPAIGVAAGFYIVLFIIDTLFFLGRKSQI